MENNPLFDHVSKNYNVNLLESDEYEIKRICRTGHVSKDGGLHDLNRYLKSEHGIDLSAIQLLEIKHICLLIDIYDPEPEPLKFQRPMTKEVLIAVIEDSRAHVLNRPKYFCYKLKDYIKLKREQANYRKQAIAK